MESKIKWGIIGLGGIAIKFANDLKLIEDAELVAVASRSQEKASAFAKEYGVENAFGSYNDLFDFKGVDVLYIATPHNSHAELSIAAMRKGKHVLCEKPIAIHSEDLKRMISVANEEKVFLMEAMWSRFNPSIQKVKQLVDNGKIGDIGYVNADFTFYGLDRDVDSRILNPELGGGSILDIGIYPMFFSYLFLGMPQKIIAVSSFHTTGVEKQTSMIFEYKNAHAVLHSGIGTNLEVKAKISGASGSLSLMPMWHCAQGYALEQGGEVENFNLPTIGMGYSHEILEVHNCLRENKLQSNLWSHQNSIDLLKIMDAVREEVGVQFPFES